MAGEFKKLCSQIKKAMVTGAVSAVNKSLVDTQSKMTKILADQTGLKATAIKDRTNLIKASTNILSTPILLGFSAGDYSLSAAASLDPTYTSLQAGDLISLDLISSQVEGDSLFLRVDYERI